MNTSYQDRVPNHQVNSPERSKSRSPSNRARWSVKKSLEAKDLAE